MGQSLQVEVGIYLLLCVELREEGKEEVDFWNQFAVKTDSDLF